MGFFSNGLKNEFETAMVNEPSVFEPLKVYCNVIKYCGRSVLANSVAQNKTPHYGEWVPFMGSNSVIFMPFLIRINS